MAEQSKIDQQMNRRRSRTLIGILVAVAVLIGLSWLYGSDDSDNAANSAEPAVQPAGGDTHQVVYEVDGSAIEASVTISTPTGTQQLDANARLGGDDLHTMTVDSGEFLYISAQNQNELGSIVCRIIVDGAVIAENESTASYGIATCEGTAG